MKRVLIAIMAVLSISLMAGCSWERIPPAHKGKVLTGSGYQQEVLDPSRHMMPFWHNLILLDMSVQTFSEDMVVILQDRLELKFDVKFRASLRNDPDIINSMFNDIKVDRKEGLVDLRTVYEIYGLMVIENKSREVLNKYTSEEVYLNYSNISSELAAAIKPELESTPLELENVIISGMEFPPVVTDAIEVAKERELDIQRERAQNEIDLLRKENERALAEAEYQTRMTKAKTIRDENRTIAEGITDDLLQYYQIEVQKEFAKQASKGGNMTFMPIESLSTVGGSVRTYSK